MIFVFTKTGRLFLAVSVLMYLASLTSQSGLLLFLISILAGCYLVNFGWAWRNVRQVELQTPESVHISEGQRAAQPWRLTNRGRHWAGFVQVESPDGVLGSVAALAPLGAVSFLPDLIYWKRGVYLYTRLSLGSVYPFGFIKAVRPMKLPGEVVVYPAVYHAQPPRAAGYDVMVGGKFKGNRRTMSGSIFAGVRPMQAGDPLKQIHWKSSAKGQGLMVKTFEEELSGRVSFIMDCGQAGDAKILDDCVRATGSLIFAALDEGHHVEWIDLKQLHLRLIPPFADGHEVLDELARIEEDRGCLQESALRQAVQKVSNKSAVHFVLTAFNAAAREAVLQLKSQNRVVALYLPETGEAVEDLGGVPVFTYSECGFVERV